MCWSHAHVCIKWCCAVLTSPVMLRVQCLNITFAWHARCVVHWNHPCIISTCVMCFFPTFVWHTRCIMCWSNLWVTHQVCARFYFSMTHKVYTVSPLHDMLDVYCAGLIFAWHTRCVLCFTFAQHTWCVVLLTFVWHTRCYYFSLSHDTAGVYCVSPLHDRPSGASSCPSGHWHS